MGGCVGCRFGGRHPTRGRGKGRLGEIQAPLRDGARVLAEDALLALEGSKVRAGLKKVDGYYRVDIATLERVQEGDESGDDSDS